MQVQEYIMLKQECTTPYMPQNIDGSYSTVVTIFRQPAPANFYFDDPTRYRHGLILLCFSVMYSWQVE